MKQLRQSKGIYFYVPKQFQDEVEIQVTFKALSHGQLLSLENLMHEGRHNEFTYQSCKLAVISIEDRDGNILPFTSLSPNTLADVSLKILEQSSTTQEDLDNLQEAVEVKFSKTFQSDTWNCETCKAKRLDRTRNCGFLDELTKDPTFKIIAEKQVYTSCPIYSIDGDILADGVDSYIMYDSKLLPDAGGLYDQTRFFVLSSTIITQKLREEEAKEAKAAKRKNNKR